MTDGSGSPSKGVRLVRKAHLERSWCLRAGLDFCFGCLNIASCERTSSLGEHGKPVVLNWVAGRGMMVFLKRRLTDIVMIGFNFLLFFVISFPLGAEEYKCSSSCAYCNMLSGGDRRSGSVASLSAP